MSNKVYEVITQAIIEKLEQGVVPWHMPWIGPRNLVSKRTYHGINTLLLGMQPFESPYWLTWNQIHELGGRVKTGSKSSIVTFCKRIFVKSSDGDTVEEETIYGEKRIYMMRYYRVFNALQTEGIDVPALASDEPEPIVSAQSIVDAMPNRPAIINGPMALYSSNTDQVTVPALASFDTAENYYATLFHELIHSTGHPSRLSRQLGNRFGSPDYAREELIAEIGAAFLCGISGIDNRTVDNSASYINSWLGALRKDARLVITAASKAQAAADYIQGITAEAAETVAA